MDNAFLGLYLGYLTFMLGLYLMADEVFTPKIARYVRMTAVMSLFWGGLMLILASIIQMRLGTL